MTDGVGNVTTLLGRDFDLAGEVQTPGYLAFLEPVIVVPSQFDRSEPAPVAVLVVVAARPDLIAPVSQAVQSVLGVSDPSTITISTSEDLADLRAIIEQQLGSFGRELVVAVFALTGVLVAAILYGLVMLRRKDFGRRRALGASQSFIVMLLLIQVAALAAVGAFFGSAGALTGLLLSGDPLPGVDYFIAVGVFAVAVGVLAAVVPAWVAATRDPLKELRVP
ncbi:FtsX-like permease family protein [Salinibacterium hongtaonis]|uniref:FtsX-like permease family protein n=1 Tax=Homoserinimonas hongtaonis TaxID=2079791 RepID=UPI00131F14B8|nr:FtsX-like permease family protein [Salinibacterium hongtaonis]